MARFRRRPPSEIAGDAAADTRRRRSRRRPADRDDPPAASRFLARSRRAAHLADGGRGPGRGLRVGRRAHARAGPADRVRRQRDAGRGCVRRHRAGPRPGVGRWRADPEAGAGHPVRGLHPARDHGGRGPDRARPALHRHRTASPRASGPLPSCSAPAPRDRLQVAAAIEAAGDPGRYGLVALWNAWMAMRYRSAMPAATFELLVRPLGDGGGPAARPLRRVATDVRRHLGSALASSGSALDLRGGRRQQRQAVLAAWCP